MLEGCRGGCGGDSGGECGASPTTPITITLHANHYAQLSDDTDIVAALQAKTQHWKVLEVVFHSFQHNLTYYGKVN